MVVEQVVIDRENNVDITLAIPIDDDSSEPDSPDPESPQPESVAVASKPESTEGGRRVSVLKRQEGAPVLLG